MESTSHPQASRGTRPPGTRRKHPAKRARIITGALSLAGVAGLTGYLSAAAASTTSTAAAVSTTATTAAPRSRLRRGAATVATSATAGSSTVRDRHDGGGQAQPRTTANHGGVLGHRRHPDDHLAHVEPHQLRWRTP